ncbi:peptide deformylase [Pararhodobacter sp. SW119]|uniref:peptide deformylase n=1 Tax=Pararhodobacter sp. SW119 TaxID=2780075 RepID=UPI001AE09AA5|nr:peptide deformylase [Pararhodobacter sp. SW119]
MAILPILRFPDPRLRRVAIPIAAITDETRTLANDMLETMYAAPGRGLAGPQVGVMLRLFVIDVTWKEGTRSPRVFLNPEIIEASEVEWTGIEGCLSIPGVPASVARPAEVTLRWSDLDGLHRTERLSGAEAICAQHELDHLNGRLIIDLMDEDARAAAATTLREMALA